MKDQGVRTEPDSHFVQMLKENKNVGKARACLEAASLIVGQANQFLEAEGVPAKYQIYSVGAIVLPSNCPSECLDGALDIARQCCIAFPEAPHA